MGQQLHEHEQQNDSLELPRAATAQLAVLVGGDPTAQKATRATTYSFSAPDQRKGTQTADLVGVGRARFEGASP